jgi:hypothetical protein
MPDNKGDPMVRAQGRVKPDRQWYPENFDWYLKWVASIFVMSSLIMRSAGAEYRLYDLILGTVGVLLWTWVSIIWRDRALIMLNAVSAFLLISTLLREL